MFLQSTTKIRSFCSRIRLSFVKDSLKINQGTLYFASRTMATSEVGSGAGKGGGGGGRLVCADRGRFTCVVI